MNGLQATGERTPVTVFCGFLGAGKTTLLRHLLSQAGAAGPGGRSARWAAVVNDLASVNMDAVRVRMDEGGAEVVELGGGCVCCSGNDDLGEAILRLARRGGLDHIWVETSGVAEPRGVAALFTRKNPFGPAPGDLVRLEALVTVVDVVALAREAARATAIGERDGLMRHVARMPERPLFELMVEQIECADLVVLNQCDRVRGDEVKRAEELVVGLNPQAEIVRAEYGRLPPELFTGRTRFDPARTLGAARWIAELNRAAAFPTGGVVRRPAPAARAYHENKYGLSSLVYRARAPFDEDRLAAVFAGGLPGVVRAKGFFWTTRSPDEMGFLSLAGGVLRRESLSVWWAARIASRRARPEDRPPAVIAAWEEPFGDRRQEIVLIGVGTAAREADFTAALDACLDRGFRLRAPA